MKNSQNRLSQLKHQLQEKKLNGIRSVTWKLTMEQKEYLETLGYEVVPVLYAINTRRITVMPSSNGLLRYINRAAARGQKQIFRNLKESEKRALEEVQVSYTPIKYKINL